MLEHIELRGDVLVGQPGELGPVSKLGVVGSVPCGGRFFETPQRFVGRGHGGSGMYTVDHSPEMQYNSGTMEQIASPDQSASPLNETIAYHQLLGRLARSAQDLLREQGTVGVFDLLGTVADQYGVDEEDVANAVARLRTTVEVDESVPSDLKFRYVAAGREQR